MPQNLWMPFGCSVRGASHIRRDKENQDAFTSIQGTANPDGETPSVVAVSDGHGGNKYFRSAVGSRVAVDCAAKIARDSTRLSSGMRKDDLADIVRHMKSRYVLLWQKDVDAHIDETPFSEDELTFLRENCNQKSYDSVLNNPRFAYGCTFLCAIAYDDLVLILQLGDGDILGLYPDNKVRELTEPDSRNIGNETLSLCSLRDVSDIAHKILTGNEIPQLLTLTTDGVKNSYDDQSSAIDAFYNIPVVLKNELSKTDGDIDTVKDTIQKWLEKVTTDGAGDDVTIGVLFRNLFD